MRFFILSIPHRACLSVAGTDEGSLLLASCAQDSYVRIWRLASLVGSGSGGGDGSPMGPVDDNEIRLKRQTFSLAKSHGKSLFGSLWNGGI